MLSSGASAAYMGSFSRGDVALISEAPGVRRDAPGRPMCEPLAVVVVEVIEKKVGGLANIGFSGVGPEARSVNRTMKILA